MRSQATGIFVIAATAAAVSLARTWWDAPGKAEQAGDLWPFAFRLDCRRYCDRLVVHGDGTLLNCHSFIVKKVHVNTTALPQASNMANHELGARNASVLSNGEHFAGDL